MLNFTGKCILVNGPALAGKTRFVTMLLKEFPKAKIVNFELFFVKEKTLDERYKMFYDTISSLINKGYLVIGESIRNYINKDNNICPLNSNNCISIVVYPGVTQHSRNIEDYTKTFGELLTKKRTGGTFAYKLYDNFQKWIPDNAIVFDGIRRNFEDISKEIKLYVDN